MVSDEGKTKCHTLTSPEARCLTCGYLLRGLPEPVCPECAREFDPADPTTYDADPPGRRRRRWLIRGAVAVAMLAIAVAVFPRGILKANVTFTCSQCTRSTTVTRWQLNPPSWIRFAYPGIDSRSNPTTVTANPSAKNCSHQYDFKIRSDLPIGGWVAGSGSNQPGKPMTVNNVPVSIDTAPQALRALLKPGNNGISVGP